jgi:transposase
MEIKTVGIDLAKNVFQIHGMNERGKPILRKQLKRDQVVVFFANLLPCLIGMEACSSAHYWARKLEELSVPYDSWLPNSSNPMSRATKMTQQMPKPSARL